MSLFPELVSGARDWFRFLNVGEADAMLDLLSRNRNGDVIRHHHYRIPLLCCWDVDEGIMGNVTGTVEVQSTQLIAGERHLHYQGVKLLLVNLDRLFQTLRRRFTFPK